jgi:hypothetical protein
MATRFLEASFRFARWATGVAPALALVGCSSSAPGGDPWADDPFADAAPPDVWADASYLDPASDAGAVTWDGWVSGFSSVYCVGCHNPEAACGGSGCHTPDNPSINALLFDMREKSAWTDRLATIHCGIVAVQPAGWSCNVPAETYPKMFPGFPLPTDEARAIVADWLEAGCP